MVPLWILSPWRVQKSVRSINRIRVNIHLLVIQFLLSVSFSYLSHWHNLSLVRTHWTARNMHRSHTSVSEIIWLDDFLDRWCRVKVKNLFICIYNLLVVNSQLHPRRSCDIEANERTTSESDVQSELHTHDWWGRSASFRQVGGSSGIGVGTTSQKPSHLHVVQHLDFIAILIKCLLLCGYSYSSWTLSHVVLNLVKYCCFNARRMWKKEFRNDSSCR